MKTHTQTVLVPAHCLPHRTPLELMASARHNLDEARNESSDSLRLAAASLAALRAASAVLASRGRPEYVPVPRRRITSVWTLLDLVAPELHEWAAWFGARHTTPEAGLVLTNAELFAKEIERLLDDDRHPATPADAVDLSAPRAGESTLEDR